MSPRTYTQNIPKTPEEFLTMFTPSPDNQICECVGDMKCLPCISTQMVAKMLAATEINIVETEAMLDAGEQKFIFWHKLLKPRELVSCIFDAMFKASTEVSIYYDAPITSQPSNQEK